MTVLLWGRSGEPVVDAVGRACAMIDVDTLAIDGDELAAVVDGELVTREGRHQRLDELTGVLVRPSGQVISSECIAAYEALNAWAELTPSVVLNRPAAAASNRSKPYQLGLIAAAGFAVPDTLVTTDPADVRAFCAEHGKVVYKSTSGVRSIVAVLGPQDEDRLDDVSACPTLFQQHVPGIDHRVHVVGEDVFACRIDSTAVDYRYAGRDGGVTTMTAVMLRDEVVDRCLTVTKALNLELAGIDLRLDTHGQWWAFEVNTAPGFSWFEDQTGLPIAAAVACRLAARSASQALQLPPSH